MVHFYDSAAAANLRWPDDWAPEIGTATIASLPAGQSTLVSIPWTPVVEGHFCFLVRIEAPDDKITFDGWVPFDNNICQRNVQIIERDDGGPTTTGVDVGNRGRGSGYGAIDIDSSDFPAGGTGRVTFDDPGLFERWQQAGGSVSGGQVMSDTNSVEFDVQPGGGGGGSGQVDVTLDRIPFEGEETSQLTFEITAPGDSESPTLGITQFMGGQAVGGNVIRPPVRGSQVYLPVILANKGAAALNRPDDNLADPRLAGRLADVVDRLRRTLPKR